MSADPASQLNLSARHADFTYRMSVLRKIEGWRLQEIEFIFPKKIVKVSKSARKALNILNTVWDSDRDDPCSEDLTVFITDRSMGLTQGTL
jgi:hypothetical protein